MAFDVVAHIGAVQREVRTVERDGTTRRVVIAERTFPTDVDDLWDALTSAERIPRWFLPISGDLRVGGRYQLEGNAGGVVRDCDAPRHLVVSWEMGDQGSSEIVVDLTPADADGAARTHLRLEHTAAVPDEFWDMFGPGAVGVGWEGALMGLAEHVSGAPAVDREAYLAWAVSPEGIQFASGSSDGWADASVAAGSDEARAREAAERTTAFYTTVPGDAESAGGA